jgi:tetratricopeptide (TPR) repeat protein
MADFDVDDQLQELFEKYEDLRQRCRNTSAHRVAREAARLAKDNRQLIPYLQAQFNLMNNAQGLLDAESGKEAALDAIAYLESDDRARVFQPDFPEEEYADTVGWMSACAYDNLAKHVAAMQGYNSDGTHQCISDGIDVCRRTGKLRCVTCFREYASDVYLASDDVPMALHFARIVKALPEDSPNSERRWVGAKDETWLLTLQGRLAAAETAAREALALAESYHTPLEARLESRLQLETIRLLAGQPDSAAAKEPDAPPRGEWIFYDLASDQVAALRACCQGNCQQAEELLLRWDRWLTEHRDLRHWFEVRLRLIACERLAGAANKAEALTKQLEERAGKARDWLTLHRLARLLEPAAIPSPLALVAPVEIGPLSGDAGRVPVEKAAPSQEPTAAVPPAEALPLDPLFEPLLQRLSTLGDEAGRQALLSDVLAIPATSVTHPADAARLLHFVQFLLGDDSEATRQTIWSWAEVMAEPYPQVPVVLNLLASVGDLLRRDPEDALTKVIPEDKLARMFQESIDLDPFHAHNHFRAGVHYLGHDNLGEAERCLARGFRLERTFGPLAVRLAEVYHRTERPRDALMVLDTCLREGCEDPQVAWEAAVGAFNLGQYEPLLTYLDRHEQLQPGAPWINYYRATGLLELGRPQEALAALEEESRRAPERVLPIHVLRACAEMALGRVEPARKHLNEALTLRLADVHELTVRGLADLFGRLWRALGAELPADDALRGRLERRLLAAGLAPDEFFEPYRQREAVQESVNIYRCRVLQPLDQRWPEFEGCLHGQEEWSSYFALWGVVAQSEEEAVSRVRSWQLRCYKAPPGDIECELQDEGYKDKPGILWMGERWCEE